MRIAENLSPLFEKDNRYYLIEGGRGGGKSHTVARYLLHEALNKKYRVLCTREVQKSINDSVYRLLTDIIELYKLPYLVTLTTITGATGSEFIFSGLQSYNTDNIKSLEGVDYCWIEEAQNISKRSLDILIPTIRKENSKLIFTMNRTQELDPVYELLSSKKRADVEHIKINYYDNP